MMEMFDDLLRKYLNQELNEDEKRKLTELFQLEECQRYIASKLDEEMMENQQIDDLDDEIGNRLLVELKEKIRTKNNIQSQARQGQVISLFSKSKKILPYLAVASLVIFFLIIGFLLTGKTDHQELVSIPETKDLLVRERHETNNTGKNKMIRLSDSSVVLLADKSKITYSEPFASDSRKIYLSGKAYFKVFKDKLRPFTVIGRELATTALGTEFTVTAQNQIPETVRLYEGKVVIRPVSNRNSKMEKEIYLSPGQEFTYGEKTIEKNKVYQRGAIATQILTKEVQLDDPSLPENEKGSWYMFNNQNLASVIDQLSALYNVPIIYEKDDVKDKYFTGKYKNVESLEDILKRICAINNLKIIKADTSYIVSNFHP